MTTYAALLNGAAEHIRQGAAPLRTDHLLTADHAMAAIADFHAVLDAIASHTRRLMWPAQIQRVGLFTHRAGLPSIERAATKLAAGIEDLAGTRRPHPSQLTAASSPWLQAALQLRAASDLVATHFDPTGAARTPDGAATTSVTLDAGLADLGRLTSTILAAEEPLALRAHQAHLNPEIITKFLPGLEHLADLARAIAEDPAGSDDAARTRLADLPQTWTPIRTDDPVQELGDRMRRVRDAVYRAATEPHDALATLRDVTTIGIAIHAHTAAFHGANPTQGPEPAPGAHGTGALIRRGRAWQALHRQLSHFITLTPPTSSVRDDLLALGRLLPHLSPLDSSANSAHLADPRAREIGAALNGAIATMTDIADHGAAALNQLDRTGGLHMRARDLPRDLVADDPALAKAHLNDAIVRAPARFTEAIRRALAIAADHPVARMSATSGPGARPTPAETSFAARTITRGER